MQMKLAERVALVTGSSSGIGRGVALAFAREGADVIVNHPSPAEADAAAGLVAEIETLGRRALACQADVSDEAAVAAMVQSALEQFGRVDILVNNAGVAASAPVQDITVDDWDRVLGVHLRGTFLVTRALLPQMLARGSGRIINTASQLAYKGAPGFAHYTAAKGAILSFTRTLALELGSSGITANCVAPGATRTPMLEDVPDEVLEAIRAGIPLGRLADVADIVPSYVFLASEDARHYQGQCISPNGGDVFL
ncbi:MAG: 3-oxoacyl-ACP reductase FabG [Gammaproteobacteria bacterium]|nr:MAG: 3-oxoacyl-ACP reductase FabG [Gammaproteobacteria bacterium]